MAKQDGKPLTPLHLLSYGPRENSEFGLPVFNMQSCKSAVELSLEI